MVPWSPSCSLSLSHSPEGWWVCRWNGCHLAAVAGYIRRARSRELDAKGQQRRRRRRWQSLDCCRRIDFYYSRCTVRKFNWSRGYKTRARARASLQGLREEYADSALREALAGSKNFHERRAASWKKRERGGGGGGWYVSGERAVHEEKSSARTKECQRFTSPALQFRRTMER